jgi:hypothetical protein
MIALYLIEHRFLLMDLSYRETCDGLACATLDQSLFVLGGQLHNFVWELSLPSLEWRAHETTGDVPPATLFHACCTYRDYLVVCGGHSVGAGDSIPSVEADKSISKTTAVFLKVRFYHPRTQQWTVLANLSGDVPLDRSHHTLTMVPATDELVLIGGRPTNFITPTCSQVLSICRYGFYDVHVLHVPTRTWRRVRLPVDEPVPTPKLWGHSAGLCMSSSSAIIVYGGFEVHASVQPEQRDELPVATVNSSPYVLNVQTGKWTVFGSREGEPCPSGRAVHAGHIRQPGGRLAIYGGLVFDDVSGEMMTNSDYWEWTPETGKWQALPFCLLQFSSKRLLSAVYDSALVVVPSLTTIYVNEQGTTGWEFMECDARRVLHRSPFSLENTSHGVGDIPTTPRSPQAMQPSAAGQEDVAALRNELAALRAELSTLREGGPAPARAVRAKKPLTVNATPPPPRDRETGRESVGKPPAARGPERQPAALNSQLPKSSSETIDEDALRSMRERIVAHLVRSPAVRDATPYYSSDALVITSAVDAAATHISPVIREYMLALDKDLLRGHGK